MLLYIDPGTGGMLFTFFFGIISVLLYAIRAGHLKIKYTLGRRNKADILGPVDKCPMVFFSDHKRYWNVFEPILDELDRRGQSAQYLTMSEDDPGLSKSYDNITARYIGSGNKAFSVMNLIDAYIVVSSTPSLDVFQWKRSKNAGYYVHILHAPSDVSMYRMFGIDYYDAILISGAYQEREVRELERLRGLPAKDVAVVGIPYMDVLKSRVDSSPVDGNRETTVLVAPSWGESGLLKKYGPKLIDKLTETGYKIIIRPHPQSFTVEAELIEELKTKYRDVSNLEWNSDNDNFDVLNKSSIMISDFSGVIFEYILAFDKPVIYAETEYDRAPYDCCWIDEEPWTFSVLPKVGRALKEENIPEIGDIIDECLVESDFEAGREQARLDTWRYMGEGAVRTADFLQMKLADLNRDHT